MSADADNNEPFRLLNTDGVGLRVTQFRLIIGDGFGDIFRCAVADKMGLPRQVTTIVAPSFIFANSTSVVPTAMTSAAADM